MGRECVSAYVYEMSPCELLYMCVCVRACMRASVHVCVIPIKIIHFLQGSVFHYGVFACQIPS